MSAAMDERANDLLMDPTVTEWWLCRRVADLEEFARDACELARSFYAGAGVADDLSELEGRMVELGIETQGKVG